MPFRRRIRFATRAIRPAAAGIANRSAYWVPTIIDTSNGTPIAADSIGVYYKNGYFPGNTLTNGIPAGLRMIAGDPNATGPRDPKEFAYRWKCIGGPRQQNDQYGDDIPTACDPGAEIWQEIFFPQCWDGKNLDSPDHKSHMSYGETANVNGAWVFRCPATHPASIPQIAFNVIYKVPAKGTKTWRLASDAYDSSKAGGWSSHGDWFNGWQQEISDAWFKGCIKAKKGLPFAPAR